MLEIKLYISAEEYVAIKSIEYKMEDEKTKTYITCYKQGTDDVEVLDGWFSLDAILDFLIQKYNN